jgi:hypothetical protein
MLTTQSQIFNVKSITVERKEQDTDVDHKTIVLAFSVVNQEDEEFRVTCFSVHHDNWTDASKELQFTKLLPNTIFIEKPEEYPLPF